MDSTLFDSLRYRSEGTDLDFKSTHYRFIKGSEADKAELLKDILAMANAWREGPAYILIGFKDSRPNPATVVGVSEHLDDAQLQQFVNSKVKPKLVFRYEEHTFEGKRIAVIAIPKQTRPFYLQYPYGSLKSNVVYVRRGSSTDEAEPPEITKMSLADAAAPALGEPKIELQVQDSDGGELSAAYVRSFIEFSRLPDYELQEERNPIGLLGGSIRRANRSYWRELAKCISAHASSVALDISLLNRSSFALSFAKVEITLEHQSGQPARMFVGDDLPDWPEDSYNTLFIPQYDPASIVGLKEQQISILSTATGQVCVVQLGTLLPGETGRAPDSLVVRLKAPGAVAVKFRILASELASPLEFLREFSVDGEFRQMDVEGLKEALSDPGLRPLLTSLAKRSARRTEEDW